MKINSLYLLTKNSRIFRIRLTRKIIFLGFLLSYSGIAHAGELRCTELGVSCVCSEPLNTSTYNSLFGYDFNPADTTSKQCTKATQSAPGSVIEDGGGFRYVVETTGAMHNALPNKVSGLKFLRTKTSAEGNAAGGGQFIGHEFAATEKTARIALRGYKYFSSDYQLYRSGTCENSSKLMQIGQDSSLSAIVSGTSDTYDMYGWIGWNFGSLNCCTVAPGGLPFAGQYSESKINGKWIRYEMVITNPLPTGAVTTIKLYAKNVTDNLPEIKIVDSTIETLDPSANPSNPNANQSWTKQIASTLKPLQRISQIYFNLFRRDSCTGYVGFTHILAAAWDTDAGQRIGPAIEIEGGGSSQPPLVPSAPKNLRIK